jgi:hypothetical protein
VKIGESFGVPSVAVDNAARLDAFIRRDAGDLNFHDLATKGL